MTRSTSAQEADGLRQRRTQSAPWPVGSETRPPEGVCNTQRKGQPMPVFTIETTYRLPVYRQQTYEAATMEEACRRAIDDDDWSTEKRDYESAGETYVTGIWSGENAAYSGAAQPIP